MRNLFRLLFSAILCLASGSVLAQGFGAATAATDGVLFAGESGNYDTAGMVFTYSRTGDGSWAETAMLMSPMETTEEDGFGRSLTADGDYLVVGAPVEEAAYVFQRSDDGSWSSVARLNGFGIGFGSAVSIRGDQIGVSAPGDQENTGMAHIFTRADDGSWPMTGHLVNQDMPAGDQLKGQISVDGDMALLSFPEANESSGAVLVFREDESGDWQEVQKLTMPVPAENQQFGLSLYLHHGHAMIGAPGSEGEIGQVGVYHWDTETMAFDFTLRLTPSAASGDELFGSSMTHDANHMVWIGVPGANDRVGAIYAYQPSNMMQDFEAKGMIKIDELQLRSGAGGSLTAGPDFVVVGTPGYDNEEGAAVVFNQMGGDWSQSSIVLHDKGAMESFTGEMVECEDGNAAGFRCQDVDIQSFLSLRDIGGRRGTEVNDIWGWVDPGSGREFAIVGRTDGAAFVEVTDPYNPIYLGNMDKTEGSNNSVWRDMKVYKDHAYIVSDGAGQHGMQVFKLSRLLNVQNPPVEFEPDVLYDQIASAHNIVINEQTGYAYAVASRMGGITCGGGLHMIDIREPLNPTFVGCFSHPGTGRNGTGNTHDAQCVIYNGPDTDHSGKEICLGSNETALSIADVSDKRNPKVISMATYPNIDYTHQGWLTEDHKYFYINDEGDEPAGLVESTRTLIFDLEDLDDPILAAEHFSTETTTDHNLYIKGNLMYQSNYEAGLRILDISNRETPVEVAFFDTVSNDRMEGGSWSNYPYFQSGTIVVTSGREGLFMLKKRGGHLVASGYYDGKGAGVGGARPFVFGLLLVWRSWAQRVISKRTKNPTTMGSNSRIRLRQCVLGLSLDGGQLLGHNHSRVK